MTARPSDLSIADSAPDGSDKHHYLAFIDGLRAVSILAVVGFHTGVPGFSGGFVGVDIFFVISGFLIINQIKDGLEAGHFSIFSFYTRRVLRILPVFLLVLLCVFAVAPFILPTPEVYLDFALAAVTAPLMVSNVFFFLRQGYFDIAADQKPLLHTWTLSVEEQFYLVTPLLLIVIFRLGGRRLGGLAALIAIALAAVSLAGAILQTSTAGRNAAFYLAHWRAWEFVAGGLIAAPAVAVLRRAPRLVIELIGAAGLIAVAVAITAYDSRLAYPSWRAVLPVAGGALMILAGLAQPRIAVARLLALRWFAGIGLVSYGWYLWHWPILSFIRISRLDEASLPIDVLGGGLLAFLFACATYVWVERPIRRWRRSPDAIKRPPRVVAAGAAACVATALIGGLTSAAGYWANTSLVASRYGIEGQGVLDNSCRLLTSSTLAASCLDGKLGLLLGDSHADALAGTFTRRLDRQGVRLITLARGGCSPMVFAPSQRKQYRQHACANLLDPFEQVLARPTPVASVVIESAWANRDLLTVENLSELISQFDPAHTRILLVGPVPIFPKSSLACVVLSDRYNESRERCGKPRAEVDAERASIVAVMAAMPARFANVRYIDPIALFCDASTCRPFSHDQVFFRDEGHVLPLGADRIYDGFAADFRWLTDGG